jgi:cyclopropane-fatty-acyl-phospholipid synthase
MKSKSLSSTAHLSGTAKPRFGEALVRRGLLRQLEKIETGALDLIEGDTRHRFGDRSAARADAEITVLNPRFYTDVAFGGSIGAGEAYMDGSWRCNDLVGLTRLLLRNNHVMDGMDSGLARLTAPLQKLYRWVNRNSKDGARRNIAAHYDLGNEFFSLWLDPTMMYSSAIFPSPETSLHEAQLHRLEHICQRLELGPDDHVIEIGTGWGGFAVHAAKNHGCRVTTTTISQEQFDLANERVRSAGLQDRVTVLKDDFRDLRGRFDKLVSIEMIEAVGHELFATFFKACSDLLKPNGAMLVQAITMADQRYDYYRRNVDFIQRYIFPGGALPSSAVMADAAAKQTDLRLLGLEDIGLHYATTLRHWRHNFFEQIEEVRRQGFPDAFIRMWEFYLTTCEGAFLERAISNVQMLLTKPACRLKTL